MAVLSDRRQRVLSALIEEYVERALPVGSRTLTERYQLRDTFRSPTPLRVAFPPTSAIARS